MKIVIGLMLMALNVGAWEVEGNPDKIPSLSLDYERIDLSGNVAYPAFPGAFDRSLDNHQDITNKINIESRVPVLSGLTFIVGGSYITRKYTYVDLYPDTVGGILFRFSDRPEVTLNGYGIKVGMRVYFR